MAHAAEYHSRFDRGFFKFVNDGLPPLKITVPNNPHLWISVGKRNIPQPPLGMFIK